MIRLRSLLTENTCPFPADASSVRTYLNTVLSNADTTPEVFAALNQARASWSDAELDRAVDFGACETWNIMISGILDKKGIMSQLYQGAPKSEELPTHYYCAVGDTILDFVAGQFWGWGLGENIHDPDRVTFSRAEYADILAAYDWKLV